MSSAYTFAGLGGATYSTAVATGARGATYNNDGTKLYVSDSGSGYASTGIRTHALTSAYDLSTIQSSSSILHIRQYDLGSYGFSCRNIELAKSGQYLFVKLYNNHNSHGKPCYFVRFNFGPNTYGDTGDLAIGLPLYKDSGGDTAYGFTFSADGTKLYNVDAANGINYFTLGTAWDVYTASFVSSNSIFTASDHCYITFKPDGTKLFRADSAGNLSEYALSTPWVTTSGVTQTSSTAIGGADFRGIVFNTDGTKLFVLESGTSLKVITLNGAYDFTNIATKYSGSTTTHDLGCTGMTYYGGTVADNKWYSGPGHNNAWIGPYGFNINASTGVPDLSHWSLDISVHGTYQSPTTLKSFEWADSGSKLYVYQHKAADGPNVLARFDASTAFDLSTLSYVQRVITGSGLDSTKNTTRARFSSTGNRVYLSYNWSSTRRVIQFGLSSNWDLTSTISQDSYFQTDYSTNSEILDFRWKSDGTMLYTIDGNANKIFQYTADTAWTADTNINQTPTYDFSLSSQFKAANNSSTAVKAEPNSFCFNADGSKLYVFHYNAPDAPKGLAAADGGFSVNGFQYDLSTPWQINTASFASKVLAFDNPLGRFPIDDCFMTNSGVKSGKQLHVLDARIYRERANSSDKYLDGMIIKLSQ